MLFSSNVFLLAFLPAALLLYRLARSPAQRRVVLVVSGLTFYGYWDWRYISVLAFIGAASYGAAAVLDGKKTQGAPMGASLALTVGTLLAPLVVFKYYDFGVRSLSAVSGQHLPALGLLAPIGISFFTFNAISYCVDVAVGRGKPSQNPLEYAVYLTFFPQLVSGPLSRFRDLQASLGAPSALGRPSESGRSQIPSSVGLFIVGLAKKVLIADTLGRWVDPLLATPEAMSASAAWVAALAYAFQLYFDFSGYSDMAVGLGGLFGVALPRNFDSPYQAVGVRDFWRRWHISLSNWLRDYLFLPINYAVLRRLGDVSVLGLREEYWSYFVATLATMTIAGLWHGPSWTFVLWGTYYGVLLCIEQTLSRRLRRVSKPLMRSITLSLVVLGWVAFRSEDLSMAGRWYAAMAGFGGGSLSAPTGLVALVGACLVATQVLPEAWKLDYRASSRWTASLAALFFVCYLFLNSSESNFIYYQF